MKQLDFLIEADKVKHILRKSKLFDGSRLENDAEHSWTICLMAVLFEEYANTTVNLEKVLKMLLVHDLVEVHAGDTFLYAHARATAVHDERAAAEKIFGMLPVDQAEAFFDLWQEFEARATQEAKFAAVLDRFEPVLQNYKTEGFTWKTHGITKSMVLAKNAHIKDGSEDLWGFFQHLIDDCVSKGYLADG